MSGKYAFTIRSLSVHLLPDKLAAAGITALSARRSAKNEITFTVAGKDREKVFAILRGSCYNVVKVRERGLASVYKKCRKRAGLLAGAVLFCVLVAAFQSRVLRIEVVGNGAYYQRQVLQFLREEGVTLLSPRPKEFGALTARVLSLPRVSFCEMKCAGGVLTVDVRVNGESAPLTKGPLLSPAAGKLEELVVLRGTACAEAGAEVEEGQLLVDDHVRYGETVREVYVVARGKIGFPVSQVFEGTKEQAQASAFLEWGEDARLVFTPAEGGFLAEGTVYRSFALNLGAQDTG